MIGFLPKCMVGLGLSTALLFAPPALAKAPAPPAEMTRAVTAELRDAGVSTRTIARARALFRPVSLTGGAAPDWLADINAAPSGMLCGTGGCPIEVWVQTGGRYRRALSLQVLGYRIEQARTLSLSLHGALCGKTGSDECHYRFAWTAANEGRGWFLPIAPSAEMPGYPGTLVQADMEATHKVPVLAAQEAAYARWCRASGGIAEASDAAALLPDLTGDSRPEALFDANRAYCTLTHPDGAEEQAACSDPAVCQSVIYTSTATGWQAGPPRKPFEYWIKWTADRPRMAIADADCGMCEVHEIDLAP